ncbi:MAG TPA: hypothetical protein VJK54_04520, partial [Chthoniobacterales bacterium]|nr:hypothetical protein [Chthoniobacterales bacterium]
TAYQFCIKGLSLECDALMQEYSAQSEQSFANGNNIEAANFKGAADMADSAIEVLKDAVQVRNEGNIAIAEACEQSAQYYLQAAHKKEEAVLQFKIAKQYEESADYYAQAGKAKSNGNHIDYERFNHVAYSADFSAKALKKEAISRSQNDQQS